MVTGTNRYMGTGPVPVLWIRIRKDPHHFGNLDQHPHQIKIRIRIRIRIKMISWIRNRIRIRITLQKCMEYEPILALFQGFEPFFEI